MKPSNPKLFDRRLIQRHLNNGVVAADDYRKYLKSLPDDTGNSSEVKIDDDEALLEKEKEKLA